MMSVSASEMEGGRRKAVADAAMGRRCVRRMIVS